MKGGWRYATTPAGAMSVMMIGIIQMPRLPAENLAFLVHVSSKMDDKYCECNKTHYLLLNLGEPPDICQIFSDIGRVIWLDEVNCNGSETKLFNCPHMAIGKHDCILRETVVLECCKFQLRRKKHGP